MTVQGTSPSPLPPTHPEQAALPRSILPHDHGAAARDNLKGELADQRGAVWGVEGDAMAADDLAQEALGGERRLRASCVERRGGIRVEVMWGDEGKGGPRKCHPQRIYLWPKGWVEESMLQLLLQFILCTYY